jgi:hypothetical protein
MNADPTLPRYGTDCPTQSEQVHRPLHHPGLKPGENENSPGVSSIPLTQERRAQFQTFVSKYNRSGSRC